MPNTGHYTLCPYFVAEKNRTIHCEDAFRRFDIMEEKHAWMKSFCDASWTECPYAIELTRIYEEIERGGMTMNDLDAHKLKEFEKENKALASKCGRLERELQQKEYAIKKKDEKYTVLKNHYDTLLKRFHEISGKLREIDSTGRAESEKFMREADALLAECTERMNKITCYLMDISKISELRESVVDEWRRDRDKVIVTKRDNDGRYWISVNREEYMKHGNDAQTRETE